MQLIVGLGNPGRRYAANRHNIGFMAVDAIHRRPGFSAWRARFEGEVAEGLGGGAKAFLLKPATYMNESGRSVGQALRFHKLSPADLVVIHDDLDLEPGKVRIKTGGGNGGHNGLKSIDAHVGKDYRRIRVGIGHPGARELVNGYVLHDFAKADETWIAPLLDALADGLPLLATGDDAALMNRLHRATAGAVTGPDRPGAEPPPSAALSTKPRLLAKDRGVTGALADSLRKLLHKG